MLFKIKLENAPVYEKLAANTAEKALTCWLLNHTEYYQKDLLRNNNKILNVDLNGEIYELNIKEVNIN